MFVQHPQAHGLVGILANHFGEALRKLGAEGAGSGMVLFPVTLARHLELAAQAMDELAHAAFGEFFGGALFNPFLRVARLAEGAGLKLVDELLGQLSVDGRGACARPVAFEQLFEAFLHQFVPMVENGLPGHPGDFHDVGDGIIMLGDQI